MARWHCAWRKLGALAAYLFAGQQEWLGEEIARIVKSSHVTVCGCNGFFNVQVSNVLLPPTAYLRPEKAQNKQSLKFYGFPFLS